MMSKQQKQHEVWDGVEEGEEEEEEEEGGEKTRDL